MNKLREHLAPLRQGGRIAVWHDRGIIAGHEWETEIDKNLEKADLILLLVSPAFMNSGYCYGKEMQRALQRHDEGGAVVIPVVARPIDWHQTPIGKLQAVPRDGRPITMWAPQDAGWADAAQGIRAAVDSLLERWTDSNPNRPTSTTPNTLKRARTPRGMKSQMIHGGSDSGQIPVDQPSGADLPHRMVQTIDEFPSRTRTAGRGGEKLLESFLYLQSKGISTDKKSLMQALQNRGWEVSLSLEEDGNELLSLPYYRATVSKRLAPSRAHTIVERDQSASAALVFVLESALHFDDEPG